MTELSEIAMELVARLQTAKRTLSTAESCTGGLIAKEITDVSGCSAVFLGGCVTYTNEIKTKLLGVDPQIFDTYTEVSEPCAKAMAEGVRRNLETDIGISTTGYAGPTGGTQQDPVGTVYIAVATAQNTVCQRMQAPKGSSREQVRAMAAEVAMQMAVRALEQDA